MEREEGLNSWAVTHSQTPHETTLINHRLSARWSYRPAPFETSRGFYLSPFGFPTFYSGRHRTACELDSDPLKIFHVYFHSRAAAQQAFEAGLIYQFTLEFFHCWMISLNPVGRPTGKLLFNPLWIELCVELFVLSWSKFESRNPRFETILNAQISNVPKEGV